MCVCVRACVSVSVCVCVCVNCYSCSRINDVQKSFYRLQGSADAANILDLNFWHRSFLTTIITHCLSFHAAKKLVHHDNNVCV